MKLSQLINALEQFRTSHIDPEVVLETADGNCLHVITSSRVLFNPTSPLDRTYVVISSKKGI